MATFIVPNVQMIKMKEGGRGGGDYCNTAFLPSIKYNMLGLVHGDVTLHHT